MSEKRGVTGITGIGITGITGIGITRIAGTAIAAAGYIQQEGGGGEDD